MYFKNLLLLLCSITLLLTGCSNTGDSPSTPVHKITLAYTNQPESILIRIALEKGYFKRHGLQVEPQLHSYGRLALLSVLEGKADIATVAETPIILSIFKGEKIYILANIFMSTENNAVIARKSSGINAPRDLRGKRIAFVPGTTSEFFMDAFLQSKGLTTSDVRAIGMQPKQISDAIKTGTIDAAAIWNFELQYIRKELGDNAILFFGKELYTQTFNLAAQQEFVRKNPEAINKLLLALIDAEIFARQNPEEAQSIISASLNVSRELLKEIWPLNTYTVTLSQALLVTLEDESRWAIKAGLTNTKTLPDYLSYIYLDGLRSVKPEAVRIIR